MHIKSAVLRVIRPYQWVKNLLVFAPLVFSGSFFVYSKLSLSFIASVSISFAASSVYIINDILDREDDRKHPKKKNRPIASKKLSIKKALVLSLVLLVISLILSTYVNIFLTILIISYLILNILYSVKLKHIVIIDIIFVSLMYLLRIFIGAIAINVEISQWLFLTTFFAALFIIVAKRKCELVSVCKSNSNTRKVLNHYNDNLLDYLIITSLSSTIIFYALYTTTKESIFTWSVFFIIFVFARYLYLIFVKKEGEEPEKAVFKDKQIFVATLCWTLFIMLALYV